MMGAEQISNPLITVITVVYNDAKHIEDTILSVVNQTYPNIEYIIIDGGSTDGTVDIIKKYADRIAYWVSEPDKGIYDAMNKGLKKATGEWVNFMNSGDCFAQSKTLECIKKYINLNFIAIYGDAVYLRAKGREVRIAKNVDYINRDMPITHQAFLIRTWYAKTIGFSLDYKYASDYFMIYHLYKKYKKIAFLHISVIVCEYEACSGLTMQNQNAVFGEVLSIRRWNIRWFWDFSKYVFKKLVAQ